eukprot:1493249-Rhodomonas_salina.2
MSPRDGETIIQLSPSAPQPGPSSLSTHAVNSHHQPTPQALLVNLERQTSPSDSTVTVNWNPHHIDPLRPVVHIDIINTHCSARTSERTQSQIAPHQCNA